MGVQSNNNEDLNYEFPIGVFPDIIKDIILKTHECSDYPIDYIASSILFASAVAIGNTHCVEVKTNWTETPILFMSIVGSPGVNKTHPLAFAMDPLLDKDIEENMSFKKAIEEYESLLELTRKEREERGLNPHPIEPKLKKYVVSDITPESLSSILEYNPRGIALYADELASWFNNFNRYSKGSEEQFWLMAYSASPIQINRKNMKGSISIKRPYISVVGTIQPSLLRDLAEGSRSKNGFIDRILFVYPPRIMKKYWGKENLPVYITNSWMTIINKLLEIDQITDNNGTAIPKVIKYSPTAWTKLYKWHVDNTDQSNEVEEDSIKGICSKLEIYVSRFALIMQLLRWCCKESTKDFVDDISIMAAIDIVEYFRKTAMRVQETLMYSGHLKNLPVNDKKLYDSLPCEFSTAEGVSIAIQFNYSRDNFNRFLKKYKNNLFENYMYGHYRKLFV